MRRRFQHIDLAPLVLIALTLLFFNRLAFTNLILARGDTFAYFYPYWQVRNAALLSGHLPLWSPNLFMGVPLLGNSQLGTFYPPNWLVAPLSPPDGVRVSILLHIFWAELGTYLLARRTLGVSKLAALSAAALFVFGGHISAHVEQINQLQGLAWLPWILYLFDRALARPLPNTILLGMALALQVFTGHTQTVFITLIAVVIYALCTRPIRGAITLAFGGLIALLLAVPQLWPTLELTQVSNRRGGLNINQATAFSFSPFVTGRGLLPSYDSLIFAEYIAYPGVIGLGLAIVGALSARTQSLATQTRSRLHLPLSPRLTWLIIALAGLALAYGLYNPVYWLLGSLPGFDLFRVPARWLALFALGASLLAALGVEWLIKEAHSRAPLHLPSWRSWRLVGFVDFRLYLAILIIIGGLAAASALTLHQNDQTPISLPTTITLMGWAVALLVLLIGVWRRWPLLLVGAAVLELWLAAQILPYNQLLPPDSYSAQSFTESQLIADDQNQTPPGRVLSISNDLFDPGDKAALQAEYDALSLSQDADAVAFDTVKMKDTLAANLPLIWNIPSIDGYDGGLLPTTYYTAFTSLFLPPGELRTVDGRLREMLAQPQCDGACIPDQRWLNLMGVRYLITDKVYDQVADGIFYDTQFTEGSGATYANPQAFVANAVDVLCNPCGDLSVTFGANAAAHGASSTVGSDTRERFTVSTASAPDAITVHASQPLAVHAVTLVDTRTGDYQQLAPAPWTRTLSSDIKLYENGAVLPRAFVVSSTSFVVDSDTGTEDALDLMRAPTFDPAQTVVISGEGTNSESASAESSATITTYLDDYLAVTVTAAQPGYLVLTDAYYPGWKATVNGTSTPIQRADVMFRAVPVPTGKSTVVFEYRPSWLPLAPIIGGVAWFIAIAGTILIWGFRRRREATEAVPHTTSARRAARRSAESARHSAA